MNYNSYYEVEIMKKEKNKVMHTRKIKYRFKNDAFDFMFQWILGSQTHGGSEIGETFYTASRIKDGDPESWIREWKITGEKTERRAEICFKNGNFISSREAYFRSYSYFRAALVFMSPLKRKDEYITLYKMAQNNFRKAVGLSDYHIDIVEFDYKNNVLPGYFIREKEINEKRKTLIMVGGGDSFVEDLYFYIAPAGIKRGYNILLVDLPGQGILPFKSLHMFPEFEEAGKVVLDFLYENNNVDREKIAIYGISAGGYISPRIASKEKRISACIACNALPDFSVVWGSTAAKKFAELENTLRFKILARIPKIKGMISLLDTYRWRWGVDSLKKLIDFSHDFKFSPNEIKCPVLNLVGESEFNLYNLLRPKWKEFIKHVDNSNKMQIITPIDEGADGHGLGTNISLMSQEVFDWLDSIYS